MPRGLRVAAWCAILCLMAFLRQALAAGDGTVTLPPHSLTILKSPPPVAAKPPRWNILFVFADDWGRYASCYAGLDGRPSLNDVVRTPHIDRLAREGVVFRNAFVNAPSCTPCRSSLLSGRAFFNCGRGAILHGAIWDDTIPVFPLLLRDAGYGIGKSFKVWGPGEPADAPFGQQRYAYEAAGKEAMHFSTSAMKMVDEGLTAEQARTALLGQVRGNFDDFLKDQQPGTPWLYFAGTTTTHRKWAKGSGRRLWGIDPDSLEGKLPPFLPDVPEIREDVADYLGEVQAVDASVGEMLARLEEAGQLDRTLIVVSGDHGMPGVPAGKNNLYDHGVRVALVARVPGGTPGRIVDDYVSLPDLAPTFLEIGDVPLPGGLYGRSFLPQLLAPTGGQIDPTRTEVITGRERHVAAAREGYLPYPSRALRTADLLYIRNFAPDRWPLGSPDGAIGDDAPKNRSIAEQTYAAFADVDAGPTKAWVIAHRDDPQWRWLYDYAFGKRPAEELYDLRTDPDQIKNVAGRPEYAAAQADLSRRLMAELQRLGDPRVSDDVIFDKSPFTDPRERPNKK
jgi:N-sulfoglucosamine sulfohydrolase